jgi:predicted SAM-dependent methyltransferase
MESAPGVEARREFVVGKLPVHKPGLEIAPYFNPMIDRSRYDVYYVDCIDNEEIQRKASQNPGAAGRHVPRIDAVWIPGKRLAKCVQGRRFHYVVASHVMEHVPDPLGWLHEILECVEPGGIIALLLPDRRYTMDFYRQATTFGQVVGWSIEKPARPTPTQVMDFLSQGFHHHGEAIVEASMPPFEEADRHYSDLDALNYAKFVWERKHYLDVHCSVWTPDSFVDVFGRLKRVGLLPCDVIGPFSCFPGSPIAEFLALLKKTD